MTLSSSVSFIFVTKFSIFFFGMLESLFVCLVLCVFVYRGIWFDDCGTVATGCKGKHTCTVCRNGASLLYVSIRE